MFDVGQASSTKPRSAISCTSAGSSTARTPCESRVTGSDTARRCYETQWFRYALQRGEANDDVCLLNQIDARTQKNGGTVQELLVSLTLSRGFRFRAQEDL